MTITKIPNNESVKVDRLRIDYIHKINYALRLIYPKESRKIINWLINIFL